jgi:hypothetical protein
VDIFDKTFSQRGTAILAIRPLGADLFSEGFFQEDRNEETGAFSSDDVLRDFYFRPVAGTSWRG